MCGTGYFFRYNRTSTNHFGRNERQLTKHLYWLNQQEADMSTLKALNFVALPKNIRTDPTIAKRSKLLAQLEQQKALALDPLYVHPRQRWVKSEDGGKQLINSPKRVKRWWRDDGAGNSYFVVRYGSRVLELDKGKAAIQFTKPEHLVSIIDTVIAAVKAGEFDKAIAAIERVGQRVSRKAA
jgi:hypothetical protein